MEKHTLYYVTRKFWNGALYVAKCEAEISNGWCIVNYRWGRSWFPDGNQALQGYAPSPEVAVELYVKIQADRATEAATELSRRKATLAKAEEFAASDWKSRIHQG